MEDSEGAGQRLEGLNTHFLEAKEKVNSLKKQFAEEDKALKSQHQEVQTMRERNRKIMEYIHEKKRVEEETGEKQAVTQEDIDLLEQRIPKIEQEKKDADKQWRNRLQLQEDRIVRMQHETKQLELKFKEKENEYRMINLKIKELKRTIQGSYVHKAGNNSRESRKKSARSVNKHQKPPKQVENPLRPSSSK